MSQNTKPCPICGNQKGNAELFESQTRHAKFRYDCQSCGMYFLDHQEKFIYLDKGGFDCDKLPRLAALLCEHRLQKLSPYELQFGNDRYTEDTGIAIPVRVDDLLKNWPEAVADRINRGFCNLIYATDRVPVGESVHIEPGRETQLIFFSESEPQKSWFIKTMVRYEWLEELAQSLNNNWMVRITPEGWAHFDELNRGKTNARNPVFVAMWFGKNKTVDKRDEMTKLYRETIAPAIEAAGYHVKRADTDEHNDPIMDRIISDIRAAPFVVADLSDDNRGVYYEAGYAQGLGATPVIYCCRDDVTPHFDLSGVNHVRFKDQDDLRRKLENRILGSIGKGPSWKDG